MNTKFAYTSGSNFVFFPSRVCICTAQVSKQLGFGALGYGVCATRMIVFLIDPIVDNVRYYNTLKKPVNALTI